MEDSILDIQCSLLVFYFYGLGMHYMLLIKIAWLVAAFGLCVGLGATLHQAEKAKQVLLVLYLFVQFIVLLVYLLVTSVFS